MLSDKYNKWKDSTYVPLKNHSKKILKNITPEFFQRPARCEPPYGFFNPSPIFYRDRFIFYIFIFLLYFLS